MSIEDAFDEHLRVLEEARRTILPTLAEVVRITTKALTAGGKVLLCGNGGSAADAQHFAAECVCRFERERGALPAIALTTDTSALTAIANDYSFEHVFARQVSAFARAGDVLFAISTSGNSPNIVRAAEVARAAGCEVVAFTGAGGGKLARVASTMVAVPSKRVARVQEIHGICLHAIASALEEGVDFGATDASA